MTNLICLLCFTFILATGQVLFKKMGLVLHGLPLREGAMRVLLSPTFYASLLLYGFATLLWIWILSRVPLSRAYPFVALGVVLVPLASIYVFGERVRPNFWLGVALIFAGIIVTQFGSSRG